MLLFQVERDNQSAFQLRAFIIATLQTLYQLPSSPLLAGIAPRAVHHMLHNAQSRKRPFRKPIGKAAVLSARFASADRSENIGLQVQQRVSLEDNIHECGGGLGRAMFSEPDECLVSLLMIA